MLETPCVKATPRTVPNKVANKPTTSVSVKINLPILLVLAPSIMYIP